MSPIEEFLARVRGSAAMQEKLCAVGNDPHAIAAFARAEGFAVEGEACAAFVEAQLDALLTADQKRERAAWLARAAGVTPRPIAETALSPGVTDVDGRRGAVTLDRDALFHGRLVIVRGHPAVSALAAHLRAVLTREFGGDDPVAAQQSLDADAYYAGVRASDAALAGDAEIPARVASLANGLGLPAPLDYFGPYVRHNLPSEAAHAAVGYFGDTPVQAVSRNDTLINAHRDTWFGAPFHQLNLWAPLYDYAAGAGMAIVQDCFARPLRNNTAGYDVWRAKVGLAVGPMALDPVDCSARYDVNLPPGDLICFSANHFHGTTVNRSGRARISFELRFACDEDRAAGRAAPNVDFAGVGELDGFRRTPRTH